MNVGVFRPWVEGTKYLDSLKSRETFDESGDAITFAEEAWVRPITSLRWKPRAARHPSEARATNVRLRKTTTRVCLGEARHKVERINDE